MRIALRRTIQTAPYESRSFEVEVTDEDVELKAYPEEKRLDAMHLYAYTKELGWEVLHGRITEEQARNEIIRAKRVYDLRKEAE